MLNIALFGPPGAGKGTQSQWLIDKYNLTYISTGEILREEIALGSKLGLMAKDIIEKGGLASDEIIIQVIENKIKRNPDAKGFLFDGFPRTTVQCYILEGLLMKLNTQLTCMLSLEVPDAEVVARLHQRAKVSNRRDDTDEVIQFRLKEYYDKTVPVSKYYIERGVYYAVDGVGTVEDVQRRLQDAVDRAFENRWVNIVLFGYPGAGKGTQAKLMAEKYNLVYISTGKMLREEVANDTEIGRQAKPYMDRGAIVPDELAIKLIEAKIKANNNANGFIFKGVPRTMVQAYIIDGMLRKMKSSITAAIELRIPTLESVRRLERRSHTDRCRPYDKDTGLIVARLEEYEQKTVLAKEFYDKKNMMVSVDGQGEAQEVFERVCEQMDRILAGK